MRGSVGWRPARWRTGAALPSAPFTGDPRVRNLDVPRRASAQNATPEDRFVKSSRSFDVGDGEKVCDGKPILRRHLIGFLVDLYLAHGRLQFGDHKKSRGIERSQSRRHTSFAPSQALKLP